MADIYLSPAETQRALGISAPTFYRLVARGELSAFKIGRSTKVSQSEINRFVNKCAPLTARSGLKVSAPESRAAA